MLKTCFFLIKLALFSIVVLVLGNYLRFGGRTVSDQVKTGMSHAEESQLAHDIKGWANKVTKSAKKTLEIREVSSPNREEISSSERQKLKALIRELNNSHRKD